MDGLKDIFGYSLPIVIGTDIFFGNVGFSPNATNVTTVVGNAMPVKKIQNPYCTDIDQYHKLYVNELTLLYEKYADKYDKQQS